jgi:hypothetical protein
VDAKASLRNTRVDIMTKVADPDPSILFGSRSTGTARPERDSGVLVDRDDPFQLGGGR